MGTGILARGLMALALGGSLSLAGCGEREASLSPDAREAPVGEPVEGATGEAGRAAELAEAAAAEAAEAARAAGQAAEAAEAISGEAASLLAAVGFRDDRAAVQLAATRVGNLEVFLPSTVVLAGGTGRRLSVLNDTGVAHAIRIPGLGVEAPLPAGEETEIELPELRGGSIYPVECPLHAAHRRGTLVVLPQR